MSEVGNGSSRPRDIMSHDDGSARGGVSAAPWARRKGCEKSGRSFRKSLRGLSEAGLPGRLAVNAGFEPESPGPGASPLFNWVST